MTRIDSPPDFAARHLGPDEADVTAMLEAVGYDSLQRLIDDVVQVVADLVDHPARSLPSRVEIRPARPPQKG
jgi:glycine cleavage system pyridoxal-binding protein P